MPGGMPGGFRFAHGGMPSGAHFQFGDANDIFRSFFGTSDPFSAGMDDDDDDGRNPFARMHGMGGMPGMAGGFPGMGGMPGMMGGASRRRPAPAPTEKAPAVTTPLNVSLEDLYTGRTKRIRITKKILDASGQTANVAVEKEINIKAGWKDGTKITFEREGDELPGKIPADIVFVVTTKPHDKFVRDGDDLMYKCPITLREAICGFSKTITHIDGRSIRVDLPNAAPDTCHIIPRDGMPNSKTGAKGNLKISFDVKFPSLTGQQRQQIGQILG
jgi:DnaJ-class molecular chaperone